ncbi:unnamed protein product [Paramecium sonneborni]|uniref:Myb-like DNA-binding domain containing protein n=1 Tax=Paramecium sonneborni TaxID=65129 RepID=A0A8S1MJU7_9CILI|nr:unnamed protein product [Paramecium sonneborni]
MQFAWSDAELENNNKWNYDDDRRLEEAFKQYGPQWKKIAEYLCGKTDQECVQRWTQLKSGKKTPWTKEEDDMLKELVQKYGENWNEIAQIMKNRTGNQIRNRYINQIIAPPARPWTQEEDEQLVLLHKQYGAKWTQIAKLMKDRSEIMVKNRFYTKHKDQSHKLGLKLQVSDQEYEKQEDPEISTIKTESSCKQEIEQLEPQINKKIDTKQQEQQRDKNIRYLCPRNFLFQFEQMFDLTPGEPKKIIWIPVPVIRLIPKSNTSEISNVKNQSENLKQEEQ